MPKIDGLSALSLSSENWLTVEKKWWGISFGALTRMGGGAVEGVGRGSGGLLGPFSAHETENGGKTKLEFCRNFPTRKSESNSSTRDRFVFRVCPWRASTLRLLFQTALQSTPFMKTHSKRISWVPTRKGGLLLCLASFCMFAFSPAKAVVQISMNGNILQFEFVADGTNYYGSPRFAMG